MLPTRLGLLLLLATYASAQQSPVHVRLGTVGNQTRFHMGQAIPITLDFQTDGSQSFRVDTDVRLRDLKPQGPDVFSATPEDGWMDPVEIHGYRTMSVRSAPDSSSQRRFQKYFPETRLLNSVAC